MLAAVDVPRDWIEWTLIGFTILGVIIAVYQSIQSGRVARAAKSAVERAESRLAGNQFMVATTQLEAMEAELLTAAATEDRVRTTELLIRWRQTANELLGLADATQRPNPDLIIKLEAVASSAAEAQMSLEDERKGTRVQTKRVRTDIAEALGQLSRYAGQLKGSSADLNEG